MIIETGADIRKEAIAANLKRIVNQTYKLLPNREENVDWKTPLTTIIEELSGMDRLLINHHNNLFMLLCKLEGLFILEGENDFFLYRRTIFECLNILQELKDDVLGEGI